MNTDQKSDIALKAQHVRNQPCFSDLTSEEIDQVTELLQEIHVKAGETIVKEGEPVDSVYLIVEGQADVRHITIQDGQPQIQSLAVLQHGMSIGLNETGFYSISGIRTATVVALTDMILFRLSVPSFNGFALMFPHVKEVMHVFATAKGF